MRTPRGLGVIVGFIMLTGCGTVQSSPSPSDGDEPTPAGSDGEPTASEPTAIGGTLVWGKPAELLEFDPATSLNGVSWQLMYLVYETLVEMGPNLEVEPGLAESWEQPSESEYVFTLSEGPTFSNGRALTADDVVGTFDRLIDPETGAFWAGQLGPVETVEAVDERTIRFVLSRPYAQFLPALANVSASILPMEELDDGSFDPTTEMLGTGPYLVTEHNQDESWTFDRNPHYWRDGHPIYDTIDVRIIPDDAARIAALRDGTIDLALFENVDAPQLLESVPNVEAVVQETTDYYRIDVNEIWDEAKLLDERVRFAINAAIDRQEIIDRALGGLGVPAAATPPGFPGSCDPAALPSANTSLDEARALVAEAGAEGLEFDLIASPVFPTFPLIAQVIQEQLAEIGVTANIQQLEVGDWQQRVFVDNPGQFDAAMSYLAGYGDPAMVVGYWNPEAAVWNQGFLEPDDRISELIEETQTQPPGSEERQAALTEACELIDRDAGIIPLMTRPIIVAFREDRVSPVIHAIEGYVDPLRFIAEYAPVAP